MKVLRGSRLAGCALLTAGLAVSAVTGAGAARAQSAARPLPTRSAAVSWGDGIDGRLGDGLLDLDGNPAENRLLPGTVVGLTSGVVAVSAGEFHAMALTSDGRVWTWGDNSDGGLTPAQVPGLANVTQIAAGPTGFVLALRSDGTVWGWGGDAFGVLGTGAPSTGTSTPVQVNGLSGVTAIAAGENLGLAVARRSAHGVPTTLTSVYAWGDNQFGQLGDGAPGPQPVPQVVPGLPQVTAIAAGVNDALAVGSDGSVWGWGSDDAGQLGNAPQAAPVLRPAETFAPGSGIIQVSAAFDHTLARRSDGTVLAFGGNSQGQLGTGSTSPTSLPVPVSGLAGASQVSAGREYSLAVHRVLALPLAAGRR